MGSQQFCLRWNNHQTNLINVFEELLHDETLVDVTLACDGLCIRAHKVVLSACSPYFKEIFTLNPCKHPVVILKDISFAQAQAIIEYMYKGEVNISHEELPAFLKTAETLKVKGLTEVRNEAKATPPLPVPAESLYPIIADQSEPVVEHVENEVQPCSPPSKRKKLKRNRNPSGSDSSSNVNTNASNNSAVEQNNLTTQLTEDASGNLIQNPVEVIPEIIKIESQEANSSCREDVLDENPPLIMMERHQEDSSNSLHLPGGDQSELNTSRLDQTWDGHPGILQGPCVSGIQQPSQGCGEYGNPKTISKELFKAMTRTSNISNQVSTNSYRTEYKNLNEEIRDSPKKESQVLLIPPYPLKILPTKLDYCLRSSKGSATHLLRTLMDVYFSQDCLALSTVRTLDKNIMECLKAYVMNLYPYVKGTQLNVAATDKCIQTKRKLGLIPSRY